MKKKEPTRQMGAYISVRDNNKRIIFKKKGDFNDAYKEFIRFCQEKLQITVNPEQVKKRRGNGER